MKFESRSNSILSVMLCIIAPTIDANAQIPQFNPPVYLTNNGQVIDVGDKASPKLFDLDNDGIPELYVGIQHPDSIKVISYGNMTGSAFSVAQPETIIAYPKLSTVVNETAEPDFIDYDNDGDIDMVIAVFNKGLVWFENQNNTFTFHTHLNGNDVAPYNQNFLQIMGVDIQFQMVDIDNDGVKDMISHTLVNQALHYFNNLNNTSPDGIFWVLEGTIQGNIEAGHAFSFQDFDGDIDYDYIFASSYSNPTQLVYMENIGAPNLYGYEWVDVGGYDSISVRNPDGSLYSIPDEINSMDGYNWGGSDSVEIVMGTNDGNLILVSQFDAPEVSISEFKEQPLELSWNHENKVLSWNSDKEYNVTLYNNLGQQIDQFKNIQSSIELPNLERGVFVIQLNNGKNSQSLKFVNP